VLSAVVELRAGHGPVAFDGGRRICKAGQRVWRVHKYIEVMAAAVDILYYTFRDNDHSGAAFGAQFIKRRRLGIQRTVGINIRKRHGRRKYTVFEG